MPVFARNFEIEDRGRYEKKLLFTTAQGAGWDVEEVKSKIPIFACWASNTSSSEPVSERGARLNVLS